MRLPSWFEAARDGDLTFITENIQLHQGKLNEDGLTALALAIIFEKHESAMYLARYEAKVRLQHRKTALMLAATRNQVELLPLLEETCRWQDEDGYTALMHAVIAGNAPDAVSWLIPHEAGMRSLICEVTTDDFNLLDRQMESLQYVTPHHVFEGNLLDAGTALAQDKTALHMAALKGNLLMCRLLIPHEFSLPDANCEYFTMLLSKLDQATASLFCSLITEHIDTLRPIIGKKSLFTGKTALLYAIAEENIPLIKLFIDYELHLGTIKPNAFFINPDSTTFLSESVDTIARRTYDGFTTFHYAALARNPEVLKVLLESTKRLKMATLVGQNDSMGRSALHIAAYELNSDHAHMLLQFAEENSLNLTIYDKQHYTPIDYAIVSHLFAPHCAQCRAAAIKRKSHILYAEELNMCDTQVLRDRFDSLISVILKEYRRSNSITTDYFKLLEKHLLLGVSRYNYISTSIISKHCKKKQLGEALLLAAELCFNEAVPVLLDGVYHTNSNGMSASMLTAPYSNGPFKLLFPHCAKSRNNRGETALMLACKARCFVNALIALDDEKTLTTDSKETALMYLASLSEETHESEQQSLYKKLSRRLIEAEHGAVDEKGYTALMYAARANNLSLVTELLKWEYGIVSKDEMSALMLAAQQRNAEVVEALLVYEKTNVSHLNKQGFNLESKYLTKCKISALMLAAARPDNARVCQLLAPIQAKIQSITGSTALMEAIRSGHPGNASILIPYEYGKVDESGYTALMYSIVKNQPSSITALIEYERGRGLDKKTAQTALILVARSKDINIANKIQYIKRLVGREGGIQDKDKKTALSYILLSESGEIGQLASLLTKAEGGKQMEDGTTALMLTIKRNLYDVALLLVDVEAKMITTTGYTALMYLCLGENASSLPESRQTMYNTLLKMLIREEAGLKNNEGTTALMLAVMHRNIYIVKELVPHESSLKDARGETALMHAAKHNMVDVIELLMDHEGGMCNDEGENALIHACKAGMIDAAIVLTNSDVEVKAPPNSGPTPLMVAAAHGLYPVVLRLKDTCQSILDGKGLYAGYSALGLAIKGGHKKTARLLFKEAYMYMGTSRGAIELCIQYNNKIILLELLEYYKQCMKARRIVLNLNQIKEVDTKISTGSLRDAFIYGLTTDNIQVMHLSTELLGPEMESIKNERIPEDTSAGTRFYAMLLRDDGENIINGLKKCWKWMLHALYQVIEGNSLALLLVDRLMSVVFEGDVEDAMVNLVYALRELDADSCCICMDEDAEVILFPCKHMIACRSCSRGLVRCPYCRNDIKSVVEPCFAHILEISE